MADNKIKVQLEVDDKGSLKQTKAKADAAAKSTGRLGEAAGTTDRRLKGASQQSSNTSKNFSKMAQGIEGGLVPAYAELAATVFAVTAVFQALKVAADFRVTKDAQVAFTAATGVGMRSLTKDIQQASDSMLGFQAASEAASIGIASGLSKGQLTELAEGAANVSKILGRDVTDSFNRLIRGVTKAEPELLDELGITLRLADAKQNYATSLNKSAKELSNFEKQQSVAFEVQKQLEEKFGDVADAVDIQGNALDKLAVAFDKVLNPIKTFTAAIVEPVARFFADNILSLAAAFALLAAPILSKVIPALDGFAGNAKKSAREAKKAFISTRKELRGLQEQAKAVQANPMAGVMAATKGIKPTSKGFAAIQRGEQISKRQAQQMLNYAKQNVGAVKQMSVQQRKIYIRELTIMAKAKGAWTAQRAKDMEILKTKFKANVAQMKAAWMGAMATMKQGFSKFAGFVDKLSRALGIIGVLMIVKDIAASLMGLFVKPNKEVEEYAKSLQSLTDYLKTANEENKEFVNVQSRGSNIDPTLNNLKALGNLVDSVAPKVIDLYEKLQSPVTGRPKATLPLIEIPEKQAAILEKYKKLAREMGDEFTGEFKSDDFKNKYSKAIRESLEEIYFPGTGPKGRKQVQQIDKFRDDLISKIEQSFSNTESKTLGSLAQDMMTVDPDMEGAQEQLTKSLDLLEKGLYATRYAARPMGTEFANLISIMRQGDKLTEAQAARFKFLADEIVGVGAAASFSADQAKQINSEFNQVLAGLTSYQGKYTSLASKITDQITLNSELRADGYEQENERLREQLRLLTALDAIDRGFSLKESETKTGFERMSIGVTTGQKTLLDRDRDLELIRLQKEKIQLTIQEMGGLDKLDETKKRMYLNELENLDIAKEKVERLNDITLVLGDTAKQAFEDTLGSAIDGLIKGTMSVKEAFASMVTGILQQLSRIIANRLAVQIISSMFPVGSTTGVSDGSAGGDILSAAVASANNPGGRYGGYTANMMPGYATGGIASGPQAGYPVMMHGTEAIVPLPNGREIPVQMQGAAGQVNNVSVNVRVDGNGQSSVQSEGGGENLGKAIAQAVQQELQNQKRSGGILNPYGAS